MTDTAPRPRRRLPRPNLPEVLQLVGLLAVVVALFFLLAWPSATLAGGILAVILGTLLEIANNPRPPRPSPPTKAGD